MSRPGVNNGNNSGRVVPALPKLENDKLWRIASQITVYAYSVLQDFPDEERYGMQANLREQSFDLTTDIAEATGSLDPRDRAFSYGKALQDAYSVRNTLIIAGKTDILAIEPSIIVHLDSLINNLIIESNNAAASVPAYLKSLAMQDEAA